MSALQVITNGQTQVVYSSSASAYASQADANAAQSALTFPRTITSNTTYYYPDSSQTTSRVVVKQPDGTTIFDKELPVGAGIPVRISPTPDVYASATEQGRALGLPSALGARVNAYTVSTGGAITAGDVKFPPSEPAVAASFEDVGGVTEAEFGEWYDAGTNEFVWRATEPGIYVMQTDLEMTLSGNAHITTRVDMRSSNGDIDFYDGESRRPVGFGGHGAATLSGTIWNAPLHASAEAIAAELAYISTTAVWRAGDSETCSASTWQFLIYQLSPGSAFDAWAALAG